MGSFHWFCWMMEVYIWMIIIRIMASWFNLSHYDSMVRLWFVVTDPALEFLEKFMHISELAILGILSAIVIGRQIFNLLALPEC